MKVGKESIAGTMAALKAWDRRDVAAIRAHERAALELWQAAANGFAGISATVIPDPTDNPLDRLKIVVDPKVAGASALEIAADLAAGEPSIIVRDHEADHGLFQLDPCNLHEGQAELVAARLRETLERAGRQQLAKVDAAAWRRRGEVSFANWGPA